jgi:hypothetical protein
VPAAAALAAAAEQGPFGTTCHTGLDSEAFACLAQALATQLCSDIEAALLQQPQLQQQPQQQQQQRSPTVANRRGFPPGGTVGGFSEWGALLLQREIRVLQQRLGAMVEGATLTAQVSVCVTSLQLLV